MGLFDFFRGPPTPEKFANSFIKELRRQGVTAPLEYDQANDRIILGSGDEKRIVNLTNFFKEHLAAPRSNRQQHLVDRARLFAAAEEDLPADFAEARKNLRPKLWLRAAFEKTRLQAEIDGGDASKLDVPEYEVGSHLIASLVYDLPDMMRSIDKQQLSNWGVTYYEALEIATENLERAPFTCAQIGDGCYSFATGDSYDACRLLLSSLMEKLQVKGDRIAMVPNRDALIVAGSDDPKSLEIMVDLAKAALEDPRPMAPIPIRMDGDAWVDWMPAPTHPQFASFQDLARKFLLEEYSDQQNLLNQLHDQKEIDVFVASYSAVKKDDGTVYSYCVWSNGVKAILPRTEWVMFIRGENDIPASAKWEKFEQMLGRYMKPTDDYPDRFLVEEFPTDKELAELGKTHP